MATDSKSGQPAFPKKPAVVMKFIKDYEIEFVDLRFLDFIGMWQHFTIPAEEVDKSLFENGLGFDGSSIRGWQAINTSDMLIMPDPATCKLDPFMQAQTLAIICNIEDPITNHQTHHTHHSKSLWCVGCVWAGAPCRRVCTDNKSSL